MSPARGSQVSSSSAKGRTGCVFSRATAEVGSGTSAMASGEKNSRNAARQPLTRAVLAKVRSAAVSASSACAVVGGNVGTAAGNATAIMSNVIAMKVRMELSLYNRTLGRGDSSNGGRGNEHRGRPAGPAQILGSNRAGGFARRVAAHERDDGSSESASGKPRAIHIMGAFGYRHEQIHLGNRHVEIIAH